LSFVRVASLTDIPTDSGLRVEVDDVAIGLYRVGDEVHAMEDVCPHAAWPLSRGRLEGCVIQCEAHGWPFDVRTGFDPKHADGFPIPCFAVRIVGSYVEVDLERQTNDPREARRRRLASRPSQEAEQEANQKAKK
jgi:3-phenylpropionate/trans-cinnamate dioxygenase ferredoxin subunit